MDLSRIVKFLDLPTLIDRKEPTIRPRAAIYGISFNLMQTSFTKTT